MERHIFDKNQPQGSMSLMNLRNTLRGLFQGDLMPLRPRASLVLDDMEYPSDAVAAAEWNGTGITVTKSTIKQEGNYSIQVVTDGVADRILANIQSLDIDAFGSLTLWTRCASISSAIKFYVKDGSANISYWDITTHGSADTWKQDTIDLTTPDSNNGSDADLSDITEYGYSALDASETYLFDTIIAIVGLSVAVDASNIGSFYKQVYLGKQPLEIGAKASPAITPPSGNPRIDILTVNSAGTLAWVVGDEAGSPVAKWASLTAGTMPLCLVYCKTTMVKVVDYEDAAANPNEAYIYADLRPMYGVGGEPVDETDTDARKDKFVSNGLAKVWENHKDASAPHAGHADDPHDHVEGEITDLDHDAQKIKSKPVDAPGAGDDGKAVVYDHGNNKYTHSSITPPASSVGQGELKTATGEVNFGFVCSAGANNADGHATPPGGEYGLYLVTRTKLIVTGDCDGYSEHIAAFGGKASSGGTQDRVTIDSNSNKTYTGTYAAHIRLFIYANFSYFSGGATAYCYAKQRYITASGHDHWIFLKVNKKTGFITMAYQAPDHPSANQGGATELEISHPFGSYDQAKYEIIIVDNAELKEMYQKVTSRKSLLTVVNEDYLIDDTKRPKYKPREIIRIDEYGDYEGEIIKTLKTPEWAKIMIDAAEITLKKRMVETLPNNILFKKMRLK